MHKRDAPLMSEASRSESLAAFDCNSCGACCAYSSLWPRFSTEPDEVLDLIPVALIADDESGMRCVNDRCAALVGEPGKSTRCGVYHVRPVVCRECMPGDEECLIARRAWGFSTEIQSGDALPELIKR